MRLWGIISDLSEQLNQHRATASALRNHAEGIKSQAIHSQTGFVLRRFNTDKSQEDYDSELDRMTNAIAAENQALQYDNKQLNILIKEYEQTLETLMTTFRKRAVSMSLMVTTSLHPFRITYVRFGSTRFRNKNSN